MRDRLDDSAPEFAPAQLRHLVGDLFAPRPAVYWVDFLLTALVGNLCVGTYLVLVRRWYDALGAESAAVPLGSGEVLTALVAFVVGGLAFYRLSMFTHELVHLRRGTMKGFRIAWNLLCGIPFLMPSFTYYMHIGHHRRAQYGTLEDGEYVAFRRTTPWWIVGHVLLGALLPLVAVARFLILGPLSWFVPPLRRWLLQRVSSLVIDYDYVRPLPSAAERRVIFWQELGCFVWLVGGFFVVPALLGRFPLPWMIVAYSTSLFVITINAIRTLGSHRWSNDKHHEMSFVDQLLDSVNVDRHPLVSELWGPIGTRFHALHHMFPGMPYHNLSIAHRRLLALLPPDSPYHRTIEPSLTAALVRLWQDARASQQAEESRHCAPPARHKVATAKQEAA